MTALAVVCLVALAVAPVSPASAAFVWGDAHQLDYGQTISDMSCPTTTQCTVVGGTNDETTFNPQTTATVSAVPIASSGNYGGISCWSETQCTTVGDGNEVTFNPQSPNQTTPAPHAVVDPTTGVDLVSVSCPAANQCSAVDGTSGNEVTFNPTTGAAQTPTAVGTTHGDLTSVTCPTTTECVTVDTGSWEATFDPTSGTVTLAQEVGLASGGGVLPSLSDVTCSTGTQCSASANNGSVTTFDPNETTATHRQFLSPTARYAGIACPTTSLCLTASPNGVLVSFSPGLTSPTPAVPLGLLGQGPIVCVSATQCTASSGEGATTFDPENPANATQVNFTPAVTSISCPNSTTCWFGDLGGNFLVATPQSLSPSLNAVNGGSILATSCPIEAQCTIAQANGYLRTFYPGTETASTLTYVTASAQVTAVDCPTLTTCAVGESNGFATTFDPQTPTSPLSTYRLDAGQAIKSISCADETDCVAVDANGAEASFNPSSRSHRAPVIVDPGTALVAVSCPSDAQCTAVDGIGQEVTFNPSPPGDFPVSMTLVSIDSGNALGAISCADTTECVAVDSAGQSLAGNPQDASTPWDVEPIPGTAVLTGISCPTSNECSAIDSGGEYSLGSFVAVPVSSAPPTIAGAAVVGQTLTETHAAWSGSPTAYAYQWEDCDANGLNCAPIANAIHPSYTMAAADVGDTIRVIETASNAGGSGAPATSVPTAVIPALSTATPPTTTPSPAPPVTKRPPDAAQVKAALAKVLAPSGSAARIKALLKAGGYTFVFNAPSAGKLTLAWYQVPKGARVPDARKAKSKPKPKAILVASVSAKIHKAGKVKVKIKLNRIGRKLLKSTGKSLKLTGRDSFTPSGAKQTTVLRTFSVRR